MFDLCTHDLSALFWKRLLHMQGWNVDNFYHELLSRGETCELDRSPMDYQTGSIPFSTALWLALLARHLKPARVFEVGTFIGKSTAALAIGMDGGQIWTCDSSNPAPEWIEDERHDLQTIISVNPHTGSTKALLDLPEEPKIDLFFFDGRVMDEDVDLVAKRSHPGTVYAFDDFEGIEKGVANISKLRHAGLVTIYPPAIAPHPLVADRSTLALLVPGPLFRFTAQ